MSNMDPVSERSRREFLMSSGVFAAGAVMTAPGLASPAVQQSPPVSSPASTLPQESSSGRGAIDVATIAAAEALAGITFTPTEREVMARTIGEQVEMLASRQALGPLPNLLAPAMTFNPRLPGMVLDQQPARDNWSDDDPGPVPTDDADIAFAPVTQLSKWIRSRQLTSTRLTEIYLARLKQFDPDLLCVVTLCEQRARAQAAQANAEIAAGKHRGPLHGIPWGAKDLLDTAGIATTWGAEPWVNNIPTSDATVVKKLDEAGAVLVAKLSLGALAMNDTWHKGRTKNPWNLQQGSSGSSAGSACATAAGLVGFSIGTETLGSITSPCMRCGTTGLRPTFGRVSRAGAMALVWSMDKIGPICRHVEDAAMVLSAINGGDVADSCSIDMPFAFDIARPLQDVRVGYSPAWFDRASEPDKAALEAMKRVGVQMVEIALPDWPYDSMLTILFCEAAAAFESLTRTNQDDALRWQSPSDWPNTFRQAWFLPGVEFVQASRFRRQVMQMMAERFADVHVMIGPSFADSLCLISNMTGHPSLTLRDGFQTPRRRGNGGGDGTASDGGGSQPAPVRQPTGITLLGRLFDEATLCRVGLALQNELNVWRDRPPGFDNAVK